MTKCECGHDVYYILDRRQTWSGRFVKYYLECAFCNKVSSKTERAKNTDHDLPFIRGNKPA